MWPVKEVVLCGPEIREQTVDVIKNNLDMFFMKHQGKDGLRRHEQMLA